jgi:hypothetical protein
VNYHITYFIVACLLSIDVLSFVIDTQLTLRYDYDKILIYNHIFNILILLTLYLEGSLVYNSDSHRGADIS